MDELRVPKRKTPIQVVLSGGSERQVEVFLAEFASSHAGGETLMDMLNGGDVFLPAFDLGSKSMTFMNREAIAVARIRSDLEGDIAEENTIPTEHELEITLTFGATIRGLVTYVLPSDHARLNDFLNSPLPFFRLHEGEQIALVNKRHVARVVTL